MGSADRERRSVAKVMAVAIDTALIVYYVPAIVRLIPIEVMGAAIARLFAALFAALTITSSEQTRQNRPPL